MSRNKPYQNRLEELFSSTEPVPPEPVLATPPPAIEITGAGDQPVDQGVQVTYTDTPGTIDRELSRVIEIGRELAQEQNLAKLLDRAAELTAENFNLNSVQIYLSEPTMDRLVLRGASGRRRGNSYACRAIPWPSTRTPRPGLPSPQSSRLQFPTPP